MPNYLTTQDDVYSDPDIIAGRYKVGRNAFFEVELTLAEFQGGQRSSSGGSSSGGSILISSPDFLAATGNSDVGFKCPEVNQYVWSVVGDFSMRPIMAKSLLTNREHYLYNPITRNANRVISATLIKNAELIDFETGFGARSIVSDSHKYIPNVMDRIGRSIKISGLGFPIVTFNKAQRNGKNQWSCFSDAFTSLKTVGKGDVIEICLESEFIYATGNDKEWATLAHNLKAVDQTESGNEF